jgi:hypothetical protein
MRHYNSNGTEKAPRYRIKNRKHLGQAMLI